MWFELSPAERGNLRLVWSRLGSMLADNELYVNARELEFFLIKINEVLNGLHAEDDEESEDDGASI